MTNCSVSKLCQGTPVCLGLSGQEQGIQKGMWKLLTPNLRLKSGPDHEQRFVFVLDRCLVVIVK